MSTIRSFSPKNEFRFACPVFGAEVRLADCLDLREDHCRAKLRSERRGCQACMEASKCPVIRMLQTVSRTGEDPGCHSTEPRVGQLPVDLLAHIAPIVVMPTTLDRYDVPASERELILAANDAAAAGKKPAAPHKAIKLDAVSARAEREPEPAPAGLAPEADMAAAITRAVSRETKATAKAVAKAPDRPAEPRPAPEPAEATPKAPTPPVAKSEPPARSESAKSLPPAPAGPVTSLLELARQRRAKAAA